MSRRLAADDGVRAGVRLGEDARERLVDRVREDVGAADHRDAEHDRERGQAVRTLRPRRPLSAKRVTSARPRPSPRRSRAALAPAELPDDAAVGEVEDAVGDRRRARLVGDHHDRLPELLDRVPEQLEDLGAGLRVEVARRLVREDDVRPRDERPRDRDALLLAAGELRRAGARGGRRARPTRSASSKNSGSGFSPAIESGSVMFSSAVSIGRRLKNWKTKPMWRRRSFVRSESSSVVISVPAISTEPEVGLSSPARMCISVDLPDPDGPMTAVSRPRGTSTETPRSASTARLAFAVAARHLAPDHDHAVLCSCLSLASTDQVQPDHACPPGQCGKPYSAHRAGCPA